MGNGHPKADCADDCYGCKLASFAVIYPYGGREAFHGPTLKERADRMKAEAKAKGNDIRPVGERWV